MSTRTDDRIRELVAEGHGAERIAAELGLSAWAVRQALERLGLAAGRPGRRASADGPRDQRVFATVTEAEREEIRAAAAAAGEPISSWARDVLLRAARGEG